VLLEFTVSFAIQVNPEDSNLCANYCYGISSTEPSTCDRIRLANFQIGVVALSEVECEIFVQPAPIWESERERVLF
jgi:hypothetical protein